MVPRSLQGFRSRFCLPGGGSSSRLAIRRACKRREPPFPPLFHLARRSAASEPPLSQSRRAPARPVVPPAGCRVQVVILSAGRRPESKDIARRKRETSHLARVRVPPRRAPDFFSAEIRHQGSSFLVIAGGNRSQSGFSALSCKFFDFVACLNRTRVLPTWSFLLGDTSRRSACLSAIREMPGRLCRVVPRSQKTCTTTPVRR